MGNTYNIKVGDEARTISVCETTSREITISGNTFIIPVELLRFIEEMAEEIQTQQQRKVATDKQIEDRISQRVDRMLRALEHNNMLSQHLDTQYPLPANMESDSGSWTFFNQARIICKDGLKNEHRTDLVEDIGSQFGEVS